MNVHIECTFSYKSLIMITDKLNTSNCIMGVTLANICTCITLRDNNKIPLICEISKNLTLMLRCFFVVFFFLHKKIPCLHTAQYEVQSSCTQDTFKLNFFFQLQYTFNHF